jgi:hypothetical protein
VHVAFATEQELTKALAFLKAHSKVFKVQPRYAYCPHDDRYSGDTTATDHIFTHNDKRTPTEALSTRTPKRRQTDIVYPPRITRSGSSLTKEVMDDFSYPFEGKHSVWLTKTDYARLEPNEFLNDTLIEFYLTYLCMTYDFKELDDKKRIHVFSTFFYKKLCGSNKPRNKAEYDKIKSWTNKVDIFSMDYIFVPIHEAYHSLNGGDGV